MTRDGGGIDSLDVGSVLVVEKRKPVEGSSITNNILEYAYIIGALFGFPYLEDR